ncbi:MAG TPA: hypothetical protein VGM92_11965, partial [Candidatus Kapabacteria bacterium]
MHKAGSRPAFGNGERRAAGKLIGDKDAKEFDQENCEIADEIEGGSFNDPPLEDGALASNRFMNDAI